MSPVEQAMLVFNIILLLFAILSVREILILCSYRDRVKINPKATPVDDTIAGAVPKDFRGTEFYDWAFKILGGKYRKCPKCLVGELDDNRVCNKCDYREERVINKSNKH